MKVDLEQFKDCDHCFHTFGSFGCCDTVNNELVFSCREGQKEYLIYRVLEIIDRLNDTTALADKTPLGHHIHKTLANEIIRAVLALKGGEE